MKDGKWTSSHYTTTYKVRLYTKYEEYLKLTQEIYNELIKKYFDILIERRDILELSSFNCLTELERLTVKPTKGTRKDEIPEFYFKQDAPLYFRRAAINQAIGAAKLYVSKEEKVKENKSKALKVPIRFNNPTVFYKGMYKDFESNSITIKLFNGTEWKWYKAKLKDFKIPKDAEVLSPTIVLYKDYIMIHIPIKQPIKDIIPIKYRMQENDLKVCGVLFTNTDKFAVCVILDKKGKFIKSKFISGGNEYSDKTKRLRNSIRKNGAITQKDNKKYWYKLYKIKNHYAHVVSREITNFCIENNVRVISMMDEKTKDATKEKYIKKRMGQFSPLALKEKITKYLTYKTFKEGILITKVRANYILGRCYKCRGMINRKYHKSKQTVKFICSNGHKGDYFFNGAVNLAIMCLKKFGKEIELNS